jgi:hypothetical protein
MPASRPSRRSSRSRRRTTSRGTARWMALSSRSTSAKSMRHGRSWWGRSEMRSLR